MNCPFLINENKASTNNINSMGDIEKTIVSHERWYAPCMEQQCFYYKERNDNNYNRIVECTRIDRRVNLGKDKIL